MQAQFEASQYVHEESKIFRNNAKIEVREACRFSIIHLRIHLRIYIIQVKYSLTPTLITAWPINSQLY